MPTVLQSHLNKINQNALRSGSSKPQPTAFCVRREQPENILNTKKNECGHQLLVARYSLLVTRYSLLYHELDPSSRALLIVVDLSSFLSRRFKLVSLLLLYNSTRSFIPLRSF